MNEKTWQRVAEWEQLHCAECPDARLLRFVGRPDDVRSGSRPPVASRTCYELVICLTTDGNKSLRGADFWNVMMAVGNGGLIVIGHLILQPAGAAQQLVWRAAAFRPA